MTTLCTVALLAISNGLECPEPQPANTTHVLLTVYDTALCEPNVVCLQGNGDGYFASMIPVSPEWYGRMAACDPSFFGQRVYIPSLGLDVYCGDSFGTFNGEPVETSVCEDDFCYTRMDVFYPVAELGLPDWNYKIAEVVR